MTAQTSPTPAEGTPDRYPGSTAVTPDRSHGTVRLIPLGEAEPLLAGQEADRLNPERNLRRAHDRLIEARRCVAGANGDLDRAAQEASDAHDFAERSRVAYERARIDARRAELALRQRQRRADDAKLGLRQAYEEVAHLEGMRGSPVIDLTG